MNDNSIPSKPGGNAGDDRIGGIKGTQQIKVEARWNHSVFSSKKMKFFFLISDWFPPDSLSNGGGTDCPDEVDANREDFLKAQNAMNGKRVKVAWPT